MPAIRQRFLAFGLAVAVLVGGTARSPGDEKDDPAHEGNRLSAWIADLDDQNHKVRLTAAFNLAGVGAKAVKAVGPLIRSLRDEVPAVREMAAGALWRIGPGAKAAGPALAGGLRDESASVRRACAHALGAIDSDLKEVIDALAGALKDRDGRVRGSAAVALDKIGPGAKSALPALLDAMAEKDPFVALDVAETIVALVPHYPGDAQTFLIEHLKHEHPGVRLYAARALVRVRPAARKDASKLQSRWELHIHEHKTQDLPRFGLQFVEIECM